MTASEFVDKAERALAAASLLPAEWNAEGACNRAYYAMFDAAHAALLAAKIILPDSPPKKHSSLIAAFGLHLVKTSCISSELGSAINKVERLRRLADYTGDPITSDEAEWAVTQAFWFVSTIRDEFMIENPEPKTRTPQ